MFADLSIYGTPTEFNYWGGEDGEGYAQRIVKKGKGERQLYVVEMCEMNDKLYACYSYLVGSGIESNNGGNAVVGITLRLDAYCYDVCNMYRVLDSAFNFFVHEKLFSTDQGVTRFAVSDFSSENLQHDFESIRNKTFDLINRAFHSIDFFPTEGMPTDGSGNTEASLYDCTNENVLSTIRQSGRIFISPFFNSVTEKQRQKDIAQEEAQTLSTQAILIQSMEAKVKERDARIADLEGELKQLRQRSGGANHAGKNQSIGEMVEPLREPMGRLVMALERVAPPVSVEGTSKDTKAASGGENKGKPSKRRRNIVPIINMILLLAILALLLFAKYGNNGLTSPSSVNSSDSLSVVTEEATNDTQLLADFADSVALQSMPNPTKDAVATPTQKADEETTPQQMGMKLSINGIKHPDDPLVMELTYGARVEKAVEGGEWSISGGRITKRSKDEPDRISFIPSKSKVVVQYNSPTGQVLALRSLTAKPQEE